MRRWVLGLAFVLLAGCGPSDADVQSMIDQAVESALEAEASTVTSVIATTSTSVATTTSLDTDTESQDRERALLFGYRDGFYDGATGGLPSRLDDRDPQDPRDLGYIEGYNSGFEDGSTAYWEDGLYAIAKVARLVDDEVFDEIVRTGDLSIADLSWSDGRTRGHELGQFHAEEGFDPVPLPEFITGSASGSQAQLSEATFFTIGPYTVGYVLGYAEGLSGAELDGGQEPTTEYEKGIQLGFAHGVVTTSLGRDMEGGLSEAGIEFSDDTDPLSLEGGFASGYDLGVGRLGE